MWLYVLLMGSCLHFQAARGCNSPTFNFANHFNPEELDLTILPDQLIASFLVEEVTAVSVVPRPVYIDARLVGSELQFVTTSNFTQYEEHEIQTVIILQMSYTCASGQRNGIYRQNLKEANNHAPTFREASYRALVPLPLPKHFDVSPYLANGAGIIAKDIDLVNNTVQFSLSENDYFTVESVPVEGDRKQFKAILRLREQVLKLANAVELILTGTDRGIPPKGSQVNVTIQPDLSIVYDDPPEFKDTFYNGTADKDTVIRLELIPGSQTEDVQYTLKGSDSEYFSLSVWANNSGVDLRLVNLDAIPPAKYFLNVLVFAKRTELQKTSSVILLTIPGEAGPETADTTIQKALAVLHLPEMAEHNNIFPLTIEKCIFHIDSQNPGEYFHVDELSGTLSSKPFDREDAELFSGLDFPQFWIVLRLHCPATEQPSSETLQTNLIRLGPMNDIVYSTKLTHLNIVVRDINDNSPEFTYPSHDDTTLAFPSPGIARKLLPERLCRVVATDRDEGINAVIRYRLAANDHFGIDARTGVIFPLKNALAKEDSTTLEVQATDRDGAEDGNTSTVKITVVRGTANKFVAAMVQDIDPVTFEQLLREMSGKENIKVGALRSVYSVGEDSSTISSRLATERFTTQAIVYAVKDETLLSYMEVTDILKSVQMNISLSLTTINELYETQEPLNDHDTTNIYPYIIVAAFFGTLAIAMTAAAIYYRAKSRQHQGAGEMSVASETTLVDSAGIIVAHDPNGLSCTSATECVAAQNLSEATVGESKDYAEGPRISPNSLTELLSIDESAEHDSGNAEVTPSAHQEQRKSIKFNEHVERIEVYDKYSEN